MANKHRGEVGFEIDGKAWTLRFTANALCELETAYDLPIQQVIAKLQGEAGSVRVGDLRQFFLAGLRDQHPEVTIVDAGRMMSDMGLPAAGELIGRAVTLAFPDAEDGEPARPRKGAAAGTGQAS